MRIRPKQLPGSVHRHCKPENLHGLRRQAGVDPAGDKVGERRLWVRIKDLKISKKLRFLPNCGSRGRTATGRFRADLPSNPLTCLARPQKHYHIWAACWFVVPKIERSGYAASVSALDA